MYESVKWPMKARPRGTLASLTTSPAASRTAGSARSTARAWGPRPVRMIRLDLARHRLDHVDDARVEAHHEHAARGLTVFVDDVADHDPRGAERQRQESRESAGGRRWRSGCCWAGYVRRAPSPAIDSRRRPPGECPRIRPGTRSGDRSAGLRGRIHSHAHTPGARSRRPRCRASRCRPSSRRCPPCRNAE